MLQSKYFSPKSLQEAITLLSEYREASRIVAGDTDLLVQMKNRVAQPGFLINISGIRDLSYINYDEKDGLRIGALTTVGSVAKSSLVKDKFDVLARAAGTLGTPTIREQATIGGNLCNAAPSADTVPALLVLGARVKIAGEDGEKNIPIEELFMGPGCTIIKHDQVLTEIQIPDLPPQSGAVYIKQSRRQGADLAVVGVAVLVVIKGGIIDDVRIALGAVAPTPIRARKAEEVVKGQKLDDKLLDESGRVASLESKPISDVRSSADYRRKLVAVLVKRAIRQAVEQI
ncbi:FAD binding domain-containing protein [Chloroflexota bacterium]